MPEIFNLREYQQRAVDRAVEFLLHGPKRENGLIVAPTGSGKSLLIANVGKALGSPAICFQPKKEILEQNLKKFRYYGFEPAVYSASMGRKELGPITLATIGSVHNALKRDPNAFSMFERVLVDECHEVNAKGGMYREFHDAFSHMRWLGFSASPWRLTTDGYGGSMLKFLTRTRPRVFHRVVDFEQVGSLLAQGYLAPLQYHAIEALDKRRLLINSTGADYNEASIRRATTEPRFRKLLVRSVERLLELNRRGVLVFTAFVDESEWLCQQIPGAVIVSADTPTAERERVTAQFKSGEIKVVCNVGVYCLDEQTEILTATGWVGIDEMTDDHHVAGWKLDGTIEFAPPQYVTKRKRGAHERMIIAKGTAKDVRVTASHRMVVEFGRDRRWVVKYAADIIGRPQTVPVSGQAEPFKCGEIPFVPLDHKSRRRREVANAYNYRKKGLSPTEAATLARKTVERNATRTAKTASRLTLDECALIGFWLGDGSFRSPKTGGRVCSLAQSLSYPNIVAWVDRLLALVDMPHSRNESDDHVIWRLARGTGSQEQQRGYGWYAIEPYLVKTGSPLLWGLSKTQFDALLRGFWMADGNHGDGITPSERGRSVTGTQKSLYDLLQGIGACRGYFMTLTKQRAPKQSHHVQQYCLSWRVADRRKYLRDYFKIEGSDPKTERVWCVTSSTGYIITRRNGKVVVTGNSLGFDYPELDSVVLARPSMSLTIYYQQVGRIVRPHPSKEFGMVIDLVGLMEMFGKIEDLVLLDQGNGKWVIMSKGRQLTNIYYGERAGGQMQSSSSAQTRLY